MQIDEILTQNINNLYTMRDDVALEMIEATGKQFNNLKTKLEVIEEAIYLKESGYGTNKEN